MILRSLLLGELKRIVILHIRANLKTDLFMTGNLLYIIFVRSYDNWALEVIGMNLETRLCGCKEVQILFSFGNAYNY
jgi:hypothetical protein